MDDEGEQTTGQWAPDPSGRHRFRYWDGREWTGHVFDGEDVPTRVPGARPGRNEPRRRDRPSEAVVEPGDEEPTTRRRAPRIGQPFWRGAAAGGGFVAVIAVLAWVTVGGSDDSTTTTTTRAKTTTTEATTTTTAVPVTTVPPGRPPQQVRVQVLNGSGVSGAASEKSTALKTLGYTIAGAGNATTRQGTIVQCSPGFEAEAAALALALGSGATVQAPGTAGTTVPSTADCVVTLGTA